MVLVAFAGYSYNQSQTLQRQQLAAVQTSVAAIHQSADEASDKTESKLGVQQNP